METQSTLKKGKFGASVVALCVFLATILPTMMTPSHAHAEGTLVKRTKKVVGHRRVKRTSKSKRTHTHSKPSDSHGSSSSDDTDGWDVAGDIAVGLLGALFDGDDDETDYSGSGDSTDADIYHFDFERESGPPPEFAHIFYVGIGSSFRSVDEYGHGFIPALSYEFGYTADFEIVAFDFSTTFDEPQILSEFEHSMVAFSAAMRVSPAPSMFIRPTIGVGVSGFYDYGTDALDLSGVGLQLVAGLHMTHDSLDFGLHYTMEAQTIPVYDAYTDESVLESIGLRHVVMFRTGIRF